MSLKKIMYVVNVDWFFLSHRLPIALEAKEKGYDVTIVAIETTKRNEIESHGFKFIPIPTSRAGTNVFNELNVLFFLWKLYRKMRPDILHHVGVKPVTYGSVIAKIVKLPKVINALSGMGYLFINQKKNIIIHRIVMRFFKFGFNNPNLRFILQNKDDFNDVEKLDILSTNQLFLIKGSGVSLAEFGFSELPQSTILKIILPARMLWDKGVGEFVNAARILYPKYKEQAEFILVGDVDVENKSSISEKQLIQWESDGIIKWVGFQKNMKEVIASSHIVVLPSYREGLPKSLIEACAIGRPIVTTDVPGCREVVVNGVNGFLVPEKDSVLLAEAIEKLILDKELRTKMGRKGREIAEENFSIDHVIQKTFEIYNT